MQIFTDEKRKRRAEGIAIIALFLLMLTITFVIMLIRANHREEEYEKEIALNIAIESLSYLDEAKEVNRPIKRVAHAATDAKLTEQDANLVEEVEKPILYVFVGDSRTVGMENVTDDANYIFIGEVGSGFKYLKETAYPQVIDLISQNPKKDICVIFNSGVNDLGNKEKYIEFYNEVFKENEKANLFFASVTPVSDNEVYSWSANDFNKEITEFNLSMREIFENKYIDTSDFLNTTGFHAKDGLHYCNEDYRRIMEMEKNFVENNLRDKGSINEN